MWLGGIPKGLELRFHLILTGNFLRAVNFKNETNLGLTINHMNQQMGVRLHPRQGQCSTTTIVDRIHYAQRLTIVVVVSAPTTCYFAALRF
jgi:hypothetical protein